MNTAGVDDDDDDANYTEKEADKLETSKGCLTFENPQSWQNLCWL